MKKTLIIAMAFTALVMACTKKDATTTASIVGKWNFDKHIEWNTPPSATTIKDTTNLIGTVSYIDFRTDGKAYSKYYDNITSSYEYDTVPYSVSGNQLTLNVSTNVWTIQTLTNSNFVFYNKDTSSPYAIIEKWNVLSK